MTTVKGDIAKLQSELNADSAENSGLAQQQAAIAGNSLKEPGHLAGMTNRNAKRVASENEQRDKASQTVPRVP